MTGLDLGLFVLGQKTRLDQTFKHSSGSTHTASGMCSTYLVRTLLTFYILASEANKLVVISQTHFTMEAIPSHRGCTHWTCNMAEMFVCICGSWVEEQEWVLGSKTAFCCGYEGYETSWVSIAFLCVMSMYSHSCFLKFHLACFNFTCAPKNWCCKNDACSKKQCGCFFCLVLHPLLVNQNAICFSQNCLFWSDISIFARRGPTVA